MKSVDIRKNFIEYFKKHGHAPVASSSLIPENDPTLLFANAGMNQFKNLFLGLEHRDYTRAVSSQKCVRAGGKHNDLENVGFTARHHTFFEMLGNFSFGDYFKKDAIHFAWEFLTKELGIPKEKLYVTVHLSDDEAADIWNKQEGVARDRIFRFDQDNFWRMGDTGPCGPCTEIFYDHGPHAGKESDPYKGIAAGEDRFVEIWNLVFMQYFESAPGKMTPLPKPSVDTGSGLERVTAAMQGQFNNYNTDLFMPMIDRACKISGADYITDLTTLRSHADIADRTAALRVLADHSRSSAFLIADGALPSNEGRGYVLRRIMRRGIRYGRKISESQSLMPAMIETLIDQMSPIYPELKNRRDIILSTVRDEESRFSATLDQGTHLLLEELKKVQAQGKKELSGDVVFKLYDTYGFPADLTRVISNEKGVHVDESEFEKQMQLSREKAKASWKGKSLASDEAHIISLAQKVVDQNKITQFIGYETTSSPAQTLALSNGSAEVESLTAGQSGVIVTDKTPFYAEGGGQVGDNGSLRSLTGQARVHNTTKQNDIFIHHIEVTEGSISSSDKLQLEVELSERRNTAANHSATHLLHSALRNVLGTHVTQAGSHVDSQRLRFDYTHNKPISNEDLIRIEALVNEEISKAVDVNSAVMTHKKALEAGAMALFGEKYGDEVRVIKMGDFSTELCGGTHVKNTSQIRVFKIVSDSGVSSGVRRIEAISGDLAVRYLFKNTSENLKSRVHAGFADSWTTYMDESSKELSTWIENKKDEVKNLEREIKKLKGSQVNLDDIVASAHAFSSGKLITADLDLEDRDVLAQVTDQLKDKVKTGIVVVVGKGESTHPVIVAVTKDISSKYSAGALLKEVAQVMGGKGGGRPDFAQGAVPDRTKVADAFAKAKSLVN